MRPDLLGNLVAFEVIAVERSFTRAAKRLGVTQSALSQMLRRLEDQLGFELLARTTRSVSPTSAGARLLATLSPALESVASEIEQLSRQRSEPAGTIRVTCGKHAADTILWPALVPLLREHPGIEVEVSVENDFVDIVADRFDAGIRLGERLEQDMVALPVGPPLRVAVAATSDYLGRNGTPRHPADLSNHRCIAFSNGDGELMPWAFEKEGHQLTVRPKRGPVFNDGDLMVAAAVEGFGILYVLEDLAKSGIEDGRLVRILEDWCEPFAGYYLYYPSRRENEKAFALFKNALRLGRED